MKEFMIFIKAEGNPVYEMSPEAQQTHIEKVGGFINRLVANGQLKGAQPLEMEGVVISGTKGSFTDGPYNETKEVINGYYHILAKNLDDAVSIAKADPRFEDATWTFEIRPIMQVDGIN